MENNSHETSKNNVDSTKNVTKAAAEGNVKTFVLVSTDKAVNPTNVMGASKRIAEMVVQSMNGQSNTNFVAVRFGNVLGSRGKIGRASCRERVGAEGGADGGVKEPQG